MKKNSTEKLKTKRNKEMNFLKNKLQSKEKTMKKNWTQKKTMTMTKKKNKVILKKKKVNLWIQKMLMDSKE